jgi:hypothetical protein
MHSILASSTYNPSQVGAKLYYQLFLVFPWVSGEVDVAVGHRPERAETYTAAK